MPDSKLDNWSQWILERRSGGDSERMKAALSDFLCVAQTPGVWETPGVIDWLLHEPVFQLLERNEDGVGLVDQWLAFAGRQHTRADI